MNLKPCPFCGGDINEQKDKGFRSDIGTACWVRCQSCGAEGPTALHGTDEACDRWNTRATDLQCNCDLRTKLVGDGCSICNPQVLINCLKDEVDEKDKMLDEMAEALEEFLNELNSNSYDFIMYPRRKTRLEQALQRYREVEHENSN